MNSLKTIQLIQNEDSNLRMLAAQRYIYSSIETINNLKVILVGIAMVLSVVLFIANQTSTLLFSYFGKSIVFIIIPIIAFSTLLVDVFILDNIKSSRTHLAASIQEQFDCKTLNLPWNVSLFATEVSFEEINKYYYKFIKKETIDQFYNWYFLPETPDLPVTVKKFLCQRQNVIWDKDLRKLYIKRLLTGCIISLGLLITIAYFSGSTVSEIIIFLTAAMIPSIKLVYQEIKLNNVTIKTLDQLHKLIDSTWNNLLSTDHLSNIDNRLRDLQNVIYNHRRTAPKINDSFYKAHLGHYSHIQNEAILQLGNDYNSRHETN